jgi:hypothetical protein
MLKKLALVILTLLTIQVSAQYKTDVLVLGASAAGTSTAIQAARSGVKVMLIEPSNFSIGAIAPSMDVPAFNFGIWKEWKDAHQKQLDSLQTDPRIALEGIVSKVNNLRYFKETQIVKVIKKGKSWEVSIQKNGNKIEKIKAKVLVDAFFDAEASPVLKAGIVKLSDGHIKTISKYSPLELQKPYEQVLKLYRSSGAAGFGKDSTVLHYFPMGVFISAEVDNLMFVSPLAGLVGWQPDDFKNVATWVNIGQLTGALSAYGPFFDTETAKANVRLTQGEVFNYKSLIYPVTDINTSEYAWNAVQKIIATDVMKHDFAKGKFYPEDHVKPEDIKAILSELYPRSRIWFLENPIKELTLKDAISLISFITGREIYDMNRELSSNWKMKYELESDFKQENYVTKKEMTIIFDTYLNPYSIGVNMQGIFIK